MTNGITVGDRYLPKSTPINRACGLSTSESITTVCLVKDERVTVHIDKVKEFFSIEVVMPLSVFGANFIAQLTAMNAANAYRRTHHSNKVYPYYILEKTGNKVSDFV
jgi:hypothetical protein